jgi:phasin family protein
MTKTDQFAEMQQQTTDAAMKLTRMSIEQGEHLMKLQMDAARSLLDDALKSTKTLMGAKDAQQWNELQQQHMREMFGRLNEYSRSFNELADSNRKEIGQLVETRLHAMNSQFQEMIDAMAKTAPPGSEPVFTMLKQSLSAANALTDTLAKSAEQFTKTAESAIKEVTDAAVKPHKSGGKGRSS